MLDTLLSLTSAAGLSCSTHALIFTDVSFLSRHIPVGVLFDTHTRGNMDEPWRLTVHTRVRAVQQLQSGL